MAIPGFEVPLHRSLDTGTLAAILDACGIPAEEFVKLLR